MRFSTLLLTLPLLAQQPAFEVATIKQTPQISVDDMLSGKVRPGVTIDTSQVTIRALSMQSLLLRAYDLKPYQLIAPDWTRTQPYFDIAAKIPEGATKDQVPQMLQALLQDRFKLTVHRETKDIPIYVLIVGKNGPKLKPAPAGTQPLFKGSPFENGTSHIHTISDLSALAFTINTYVDRPVLDRTNLPGLFDMDLDVTRDTGPTTAAIPPLDFKDALDQLGLKLDPRKEPMEMLVVDHLEKSPTEN